MRDVTKAMAANKTKNMFNKISFCNALFFSCLWVFYNIVNFDLFEKKTIDL